MPATALGPSRTRRVPLLRLIPLLPLLPLLALPAGCGSFFIDAQPPQQAAMATATGTATQPRTFAIFLDGTHDDVDHDSNVKRLHAIVALQARPELSTLYIEGVGTGMDAIGAATGAGVGGRVRAAYTHLLRHYHAGDRIVLFGFSRGAYEARILASMLQYIGLPDTPPGIASEPQARDQLVAALYDEMKAGFHDGVPAPTINRLRTQASGTYHSREIQLLGLWDTVEALGKPEWTSRLLHKAHLGVHTVTVDELNDRYGDQLLNVRHAVQAVSMDDDREWIFTPLLITRCHLLMAKPLPGVSVAPEFKPAPAAAGTAAPAASALTTTTPPGCPVQRPPGHVIQEVLFPGAHADVGGGYADSELSGLSLNWMLGRVRAFAPELLPANAPLPNVRADATGSSHDPESAWWKPLYHHVNRNLVGYALAPRPPGPQGRPQAPQNDQVGTLCQHPSVLKRRQYMPPRTHEFSAWPAGARGRLCAAPDPSVRADPPLWRARPVAEGGGCDLPGAALQLTVWDDTAQTCLPGSPP